MTLPLRVVTALSKLAAIGATIAALAACGSPNDYPEPRRSAKAEAQELAARAPTVAPEVRYSVENDPSQLLGLDRARLTGILGAPRFVRRDPQVQLWRYRNKSCVLHVFFYHNDDSDDEKMTVHHYEARNLEGAPLATRDCLNQLLAARNR